jgi:hypothetical protein
LLLAVDCTPSNGYNQLDSPVLLSRSLPRACLVAGSCSTVPESSTECSTADVFLFEITPVVGRPCWIDSISSSRAQAHSSTAHHRLHGSFLLQSVSLVIYHILSSISVSVASCLDSSRILLLSDHTVWLRLTPLSTL